MKTEVVRDKCKDKRTLEGIGRDKRKGHSDQDSGAHKCKIWLLY